MKRYWLFAYEYYYPAGGAYDLVSSADSIEECKELVKVVPSYRNDEHGPQSLDVGRTYRYSGGNSPSLCDQAHIFDSEEGKILEYCYTRDRLKGPEWIEVDQT